MFRIEIIFLLIFLIYIQSKPNHIIENFSQDKPKIQNNEENAYSFIDRYNSFQ